MLDFEGFNLKKIFIINFVSIMEGNGVNNVFLYRGGFISCVQILMVNILMINCGDLKLQGVEGYIGLGIVYLKRKGVSQVNFMNLFLDY